MGEKRLLVVDDEKPIRDMYVKAFTKEGYAVGVAENAEDAFETMQKTPFWVLFVDLNLPGENGIELCRRIKDRYPMAILIAVTGYASLFELNDCRDAGFEDYFTKPVNLSDLFEAAESAFKKIARWKKK
jgi:CheY-like chemotaxis protein